MIFSVIAASLSKYLTGIFIALIFASFAYYAGGEDEKRSGYIKSKRVAPKSLEKLPKHWSIEEIAAWEQCNEVVKKMHEKGLNPVLHGNDYEIKMYELWQKYVIEIKEFMQKEEAEKTKENKSKHEVGEDGQVTYNLEV